MHEAGGGNAHWKQLIISVLIVPKSLHEVSTLPQFTKSHYIMGGGGGGGSNTILSIIA